MLLQLVTMPRGRAVQEVALDNMQAAGFRTVQGERTTINGLDAFIGLYEGAIQDLGEVSMRAAHIAHGNQFYMLAGIVAPRLLQQSDAAFTTAIRSFRALSEAEAESIRPNRVDLYVVRAGDTWASIAEQTGDLVRPSTLAIMNNTAPETQPAVGARIKIVVAG